MEEKKLIKSPVVIGLYVMAALSLIYTCYQIGSAVNYINSYYSSYGMTAGAGEIITYVLQTAFQPLMMAALLLGAAVILKEVRALNPENYATAEEIARKKEAKAIAKANAKAEKAEKAARSKADKEAKATEGMSFNDSPFEADQFKDFSGEIEEPIGFKFDK